MRLLLDVNFDESRAAMLRALDVDAVHWSAVGDPKALDPVVVAWARNHGCAVVTQDLGIATALARAGADSPSVIQLRHADDLSAELIARIALAAKSHAKELERGCILVVDARRSWVRIRPLPTLRRI